MEGASYSQHMDIQRTRNSADTFRIFMEVLSHRHDGLLTPFSACLKRISGTENSKLLIMVWSFWSMAIHPGAVQEPTQSLLIRTKDTSIIQKLQGFKSPVPEMERNLYINIYL